jgi:hypothetical protein
MAGLRRSHVDTAPNAIVGAARRVQLDKRDEVEKLRYRGLAAEQVLAWRYYDKVGEIKTAYNYFAAISSRVRIFAGYQTEASNVPVPIGDVQELSHAFVAAARYELDKLNQGRGGQPNLIRSFVLNLLVPGECYLVGDNGTWTVRSTSELIFEADGRVRVVTSRVQRTTNYEYLSPDAFVARVWRTHPQFSDDADSALMGILEECSELLMLARLIRASGKSRLNAGLLYVADELRFQRVDVDGAPATPEPDVDPFEEELTLALTEPIGETDSPSEVVPLLIRGPAEFSENGIKKHDLSRNINEIDIKRFDQLLKRIMTSLDLPTDLITGMANVRYSNARTISEDLLKAYIEPMILLICEGITTSFLRPHLLARGFDPEYVKNVSVWYDPSEVVTRPDRSEDADKGYDKMLIGGATWRRAHGFSETDAPAPEEFAKRIAMAGGVPQGTTVDFLRLIAPELVAQAELLAQQSMSNPNGYSLDHAATPGAGGHGTPGVPANVNNPVEPTRPPPTNGHTNTNPPEGQLEPGTVGRPPALSVESERVAPEVLDILRSMTAAAIAPSSEVRDRSRRLEHALEVERRLRDAMHVQLNGVVQRSLERAGARTVSKTVRKDTELRAVLSELPIEEAYAAIPADRLEEFGLSDARDLVRDSIERAKTGYIDLMKRAQQQGWRALGADVYDARVKTQLEDLERSWTWLSDRLVSQAVDFLKNPRRGGAYVTMSMIRDAATLAGGGRHLADVPNASGMPRSTPQDSGRAVLSTATLEATGWNFSDARRWVYGVSENGFEPHVQLDGTVFESWSDRELAAAAPDEFPYATHYHPGDHDGCCCDWLPVVLESAQAVAA